MPGSRLYNFSLAQPQFEVTPFQAVAFEPKDKEDISLLSNSFAKVAEREEKYTEKLAALDAQFAKLKETVSPDKKTAEWFENYRKKYRDSVIAFANTGDYENASKFGTKLAAEALNDGEYQGHAFAYASYKAERDANKQRVNNGVSNIDYEYWNDHNQFDPDKIKWTYVDGVITGATEYDTTPLYNSIDYAKDVYAKGYQLVNPDVISTSRGTSHSSSYGDSKGSRSSSSSRSNSHSLEKVTAEELLKVWDNLILTTGDDIERIKQDFKAKKYHVEKLKEQQAKLDPNSTEYKDLQSVIDTYNRVLVSNNSSVDYKMYYCRMISGAMEGDNNVAKIMADSMAYTKESTGSDVSSSSGRTVNDGDSGGGGHHGGGRHGGGYTTVSQPSPSAPGSAGISRTTYNRGGVPSNRVQQGRTRRRDSRAGYDAGNTIAE